MKPYPLASDLREPALRAAMPRAPRLVGGQELASCPRRIQVLSAEGCPVPFAFAPLARGMVLIGSDCWRHHPPPLARGHEFARSHRMQPPLHYKLSIGDLGMWVVLDLQGQLS